MNKQEFIACLRAKLQGLPTAEVEERLCFYSEIIDDKIEEGTSEEQAVGEIGGVDEIAREIVADIPLTKIAKERMRPKKRPKTWEVTLLALGSPVWLALLISVAAVIFSLWVSVWAVIVSLWATFGALVGCAIGGIGGGIVFACLGKVPAGLVLVGGGIFSAGVAIFAFLCCMAATKGLVKLTRSMLLGAKLLFVKGEVSQ